MFSSIITKAASVVEAAMADRKGVTSLEYGVVAAALIAAVTAGMATLSTSLTDAFIALGAAITKAF